MTKTMPFDPKSVSPAEWTADMLAKSTEAVTADTPWGPVRGRRAPNGTQVFLSESGGERTRAVTATYMARGGEARAGEEKRGEHGEAQSVS